jgi:Meiotically up-regulated gene 113
VSIGNVELLDERMTKAHILDEIRRAAAANGGEPLGAARFEAETGIKVADWCGTYWARWGDALREAGLAPNEFRTAYAKERLLENYAQLARDLGRLPVKAELQMKRRGDPSFPSWNTFARFGSKSQLVSKLLEHCRAHALADVATFCEEYLQSDGTASDEIQAVEDDVEIGFVYLIRSGRVYKLGKTNSAGRRERELAIQLPEKATTVHVIRTDDPSGIEAYWHQRFADRRKNGEWFELTAMDVRSFKRRKFM